MVLPPVIGKKVSNIKPVSFTANLVVKVISVHDNRKCNRLTKRPVNADGALNELLELLGSMDESERSKLIVYQFNLGICSK